MVVMGHECILPAGEGERERARYLVSEGQTSIVISVACQILLCVFMSRARGKIAFSAFFEDRHCHATSFLL